MYKPNLTRYKEEKLDVLKELGIKLTPWMVDRITACKSDEEVDRIARDFIIPKDEY